MIDRRSGANQDLLISRSRSGTSSLCLVWRRLSDLGGELFCSCFDQDLTCTFLSTLQRGAEGEQRRRTKRDGGLQPLHNEALLQILLYRSQISQETLTAAPVYNCNCLYRIELFISVFLSSFRSIFKFLFHLFALGSRFKAPLLSSAAVNRHFSTVEHTTTSNTQHYSSGTVTSS